MLEQRLLHQEDIPLLGCQDIVNVLKLILPRRDTAEAEIIRQLEVRHNKRLASTACAYEKQRRPGLLKATP